MGRKRAGSLDAAAAKALELGAWTRSSVGERSLHTREVAGSKPAASMAGSPLLKPFLVGRRGVRRGASEQQTRPWPTDGHKPAQYCPDGECGRIARPSSSLSRDSRVTRGALTVR